MQAVAAGAELKAPPSHRSKPAKRIVLPQRKICILGTTPSRGLAPFKDSSWEMWTIGPGGSDTPGMRWERIFELHGAPTWPRAFRHHVHELEKSCNAIPSEFVEHIKALKVLCEINSHHLPIAFDGYLDLLRNTKPPKIVYTDKPLDGCEANVLYPKQAMFEKYDRLWFTSQISYALALALEEDVTDLAIYGIDLESGEEYRSQFLGARHFIDLARLVGVKVYLPEGCGLLRSPNPYPDSYETHLAQQVQYKLTHLDAIRSQTRAEHDHTVSEIYRREGALAALRGFNPIPKEVEPEIERMTQEVGQLNRNRETLSGNLNRLEGEIAAFDYIRSRNLIHGDDPNVIPAG